MTANASRVLGDGVGWRVSALKFLNCIMECNVRATIVRRQVCRQPNHEDEPLSQIRHLRLSPSQGGGSLLFTHRVQPERERVVRNSHQLRVFLSGFSLREHDDRAYRESRSNARGES